ncbi:hypothetical protein NDU88_000395 [Pleurodeles waltl]|uniref:Uncharacterized protein n=1 Tax=Pleurodeles waltl TaxID=8319 RepID=A0AAV7V5X0_PLEWA|nr:hypothetical protein NDU88_000395 [Pleurodeles waltl]
MLALWCFPLKFHRATKIAEKGLPTPSCLPRGAFDVGRDLRAASLHMQLEPPVEKFYSCLILPRPTGGDQISIKEKGGEAGAGGSYTDVAVSLFGQIKTVAA